MSRCLSLILSLALCGRYFAVVSDANLVHRQNLVVALDYGQFYLHTRDNDPDLAVTLLEQAQGAAGIAQADGLLVVESPHQNNFEMPLGVEIWDARPADDLAEWEEAFEAHLVVGEAGLTYESPTMDLTEIEVSADSYHALITGRGFVSRGWPGSTEPGDQWRIRLWPSDTQLTPRRLKRWSERLSAADVQDARAARRREKRRPKRVFDLADPTRRALIERTEHLPPPPVSDYVEVRVDRESGILDADTIFRNVPSQLMLVLTGAESDSLDPHGYLRRARANIAAILHQISDERATPLRDLDRLIEDTLNFDATDRPPTPVPPS